MKQTLKCKNDAGTSQTAAGYTQTNETDATKSTVAASGPQSFVHRIGLQQLMIT